MQLKIGDKVKIIKFPKTSCIGYICEVTELYKEPWCCSVENIKTGWECIMYSHEIEKVATKGQQLLFSFMNATDGT